MLGYSCVDATRYSEIIILHVIPLVTDDQLLQCTMESDTLTPFGHRVSVGCLYDERSKLTVIHNFAVVLAMLVLLK